MKQVIDISSWHRADHYRLFAGFDEPYFGVTVRVDCTQAYAYARANGLSFFLVYLYRALQAANGITEFRYRVVDGHVLLFDEVHAAPVIDRANGTFGFGYMNYYDDEHTFHTHAAREVEQVRGSTGLKAALGGENVIHFSALPWLDFTALSHPRMYAPSGSCPKISFGKMTEEDGVKTMPVSVHVHHGLADGLHVAQFVEAFQGLMNGE